MPDCEHRHVITCLVGGQLSAWVCHDCGREVVPDTGKVKEEPGE